jgi:predicted aminopeptidase
MQRKEDNEIKSLFFRIINFKPILLKDLDELFNNAFYSIVENNVELWCYRQNFKEGDLRYDFFLGDVKNYEVQPLREIANP